MAQEELDLLQLASRGHGIAKHSVADRAAMLVRLGRVFLSVVDDRVFAKELGPAPWSANGRRALPTSSEENAVGGLVCKQAHGSET